MFIKYVTEIILEMCKYSFFLLACLWVALLSGNGQVSGEIYFEKGAPHVKLPNKALLSGVVKFSRNGRPFNAFTGIPYARVTQRFQPAELITEPWEGVMNATKPGPICPQRNSQLNLSLGVEDCLNLNVYVPMNSENIRRSELPVMVWIHGGGFLFGSGFGYGPSYFMDEEVIIVTLNYRVGVFGFLSTGDEVIPGNYGLKDQVLALKWVKKNIRQFGGDKGKVTIFGESAGGASTHFLLLSPTTKGLFQRAISQSGSALGLFAFDPNPRDNALKIADYLKCPRVSPEPAGITSEEIRACLMAVSAEELNLAQYAYKASWPLNITGMYFVPVAEPSGNSKFSPFISETPIKLLTDKKYKLKEIPWMVGVTQDEGSTLFSGFVFNSENLVHELDTKWETIAPEAFYYDRVIPEDKRKLVSSKLREFYFGEKGVTFETRDGLTDLYSDSFFVYGARKSALETAGRGINHKVYVYEYTRQIKSFMGSIGAIPEHESKKVGHSDDVIPLFDLRTMIPASKDWIKPGSSDEQFSKNLVKLWVSFAKDGKPKSWGKWWFDAWKPISKREIRNGGNSLKWYEINDDPCNINDPFIKRMDFWEKLWTQHFTPELEQKRN